MTTNNDCNLIPSVGVLRAYTSIADGIAITEDESRIEPANSWPECETLLTHPRRPKFDLYSLHGMKIKMPFFSRQAGGTVRDTFVAQATLQRNLDPWNFRAGNLTFENNSQVISREI